MMIALVFVDIYKCLNNKAFVTNTRTDRKLLKTKSLHLFFYSRYVLLALTMMVRMMMMMMLMLVMMMR